MQIVDLSPEHYDAYFNCLSDGTSEFLIGACRKREWFKHASERGLRVKLALNDDRKPVGMVQYGPGNLMFEDDHGLSFIHCIWVLRDGKVENHQKKGIGKGLLAAVEEDVRHRGSKGLVAWGVSLPFFMRASWFKKQGFKKIDKKGTAVLLWKPYAPDAEPLHWKKELKIPEKQKGTVNLTILACGWCTVMNANTENVKRAAADFGEKVVVHEIDTNDKANLAEWGQPEAIYLNGKQIATGPPLSYEQFHKAIARNVRKVG